MTATTAGQKVRVALAAIAVGMLVFAAESPAQSPAPPAGSPAWVVDQVFIQKTFPGKAKHLTGEMAANHLTTPTIGEGLPADARATLRAVQADSAKAVYSVYVRTATHGVDVRPPRPHRQCLEASRSDVASDPGAQAATSRRRGAGGPGNTGLSPPSSPVPSYSARQDRGL